MKYTSFYQIVTDNLILLGIALLGPYMLATLQGGFLGELVSNDTFALVTLCLYLILFSVFLFLGYRAFMYLFEGVPVFQLRCSPVDLPNVFTQCWRQPHQVGDHVYSDFNRECRDIQGTARDIVLGRDLLESGDWKRALELSARKLKWSLADLSPDAYRTVSAVRYASPVVGYFSVLVRGLFFAKASRFRRFLGRLPILKRFFRHQYSFSRSKFELEPGPADVVTAEVHIPTLDTCYLSMFSYMESMFKCLSIKSTRRLTPMERSYWVGLHCLEKLVIHLNSKNEYQVNSDNVVLTAQAVFYKFLLTTGKCIPLIDICNSIDQSVMDEYYEVMDNNVSDIDGNPSLEYSFLHFPFPFAGSVAIDNTSMV
jgi:hypothetical protein